MYHFLPKPPVPLLAILGCGVGLAESQLRGWGWTVSVRMEREKGRLIPRVRRADREPLSQRLTAWGTRHGLAVRGCYAPQSPLTSSENSQSRGVQTVLSLWVNLSWGLELCPSRWRRKVKHHSERHTRRKGILGNVILEVENIQAIAQLKSALFYSEQVRLSLPLLDENHRKEPLWAEGAQTSYTVGGHILNS